MGDGVAEEGEDEGRCFLLRWWVWSERRRLLVSPMKVEMKM